MSTERLSKDEFWLLIALMYSINSTCDRMRTACVLVSEDGRLVSAGYNGSIPGEPHCDEAGHLMLEGHCLRTVHAEDNAIASMGDTDKLSGATAYLVDTPCLNHARNLVAFGVKRIVFARRFGNMQGKDKGWNTFDDWAKNKSVSVEHIDLDLEGLLEHAAELLRRPGGAFTR